MTSTGVSAGAVSGSSRVHTGPCIVANQKRAGITPAMVCGTPSIRIDVPTTSFRMLNTLNHTPALSITGGSPPSGHSGSGVPSSGATPRRAKRSAVTGRTDRDTTWSPARMSCWRGGPAADSIAASAGSSSQVRNNATGTNRRWLSGVGERREYNAAGSW
jgi:hypothetical protein